ncbi:MAG TPA: hypothetical protein VES36_07495 [Candidatus Limnocylindrales bacterium]|nr:hypothetical protein [Candidatus Limnocylindrales bacterium]
MTAGGAASPSSSGTLKPSSGPGTTPGRPYDAQSVLTAMRDSTRPGGGVPDELETAAIAEALSRQVWTWDGQPWLRLSIGGACGPNSCSLDVAGSRGDTPGADLYSFSVEVASGAVTLATSDLHGYPSRLDAKLEKAGKTAAGDQLDALAYIGARWLPPPDAGRYWLAYRSGGEEGAPGLDVLLDLASGELIETRPV